MYTSGFAKSPSLPQCVSIRCYNGFVSSAVWKLILILGVCI